MLVNYLILIDIIHIGIIGLFVLFVALYLPKGGEITRFLNKIAFIYIFFLLSFFSLSNFHHNDYFAECFPNDFELVNTRMGAFGYLYGDKFYTTEIEMYRDYFKYNLINSILSLKEWLQYNEYNSEIELVTILPFTQIFYIYALTITGIFFYGISDRFFVANSYEIEFTLLVFFTLIGALFLFSVENLIEFVLAIEVVTLATYALTAFDRTNRFSTYAGVQYFILGSIPSGLLVLGITLLYMVLGSFDFSDITSLFVFPELINEDKINIFYNKQVNQEFKTPAPYNNTYYYMPLEITGPITYSNLYYNLPVMIEDVQLPIVEKIPYFWPLGNAEENQWETQHNKGDLYSLILSFNLEYLEMLYLAPIQSERMEYWAKFLNEYFYILDSLFKGERIIKMVTTLYPDHTIFEQMLYIKQFYFTVAAHQDVEEYITQKLLQEKGKIPGYNIFDLMNDLILLKTLYITRQPSIEYPTKSEAFYKFMSENYKMPNKYYEADWKSSLWFDMNEKFVIKAMDTDKKIFTDIHLMAYDYSNYPIYLLAIFLIFFNLLFKITAAPFNFWATTIYQKAPLASVTFLSIFSKAMVLFAIAKFLMTIFNSFYSFFTPFLLFISVITILFGMIGAFAEKGIKKFFVYSSMGHVGFMLLGLSLGTEEGLSASFHYLPVYIFTSFIMWFILMYLGEEKNHITHFAILKRENPMMALIFSLIIFSMSGIPPLGGFFVKLDILTALLDSSLFYINYLILFFTVASFFYYLRIVKIIFFDNNIANEEKQYNKTNAIEIKYNNKNNFGADSKLLIIVILFIILLFYMIIVEKPLIETQLECLKMVIYA